MAKSKDPQINIVTARLAWLPAELSACSDHEKPWQIFGANAAKLCPCHDFGLLPVSQRPSDAAPWADNLLSDALWEF